jgi:hypothetical protein
MSAAFLCAFILPPDVTDTSRLRAAAIFNPLAVLVHGPIERPAPVAVQDNPKQEAESPRLGPLESLCVRVSVMGVDTSGRDALLISSDLGQGRAVLYPGGLAGRLDGSRVRLITDDGFAVTGAFVRYTDAGGMIAATRIVAPTPLVKGLGHGQIAVVGMRLADCRAAGLAEGDWVVLDDSDWPRAVQGQRLGRIISAVESRTAPGFVDINLSPAAELTSLSNVWVVK